MKRPVIFFLAALLPLLHLAAQGAAPVITLQQGIDAALTNGDDNKVLQGNLDIARAQHALNVSRNSFTLAGSGGYNVSTTYGSSALLANKPIASAGGTSPLGGVAGLTLAGPLTAVSVSAYPWIPPTGTGDNTTSLGLTVSQTLWNGYPGGTPQATVDKSLLALQGKELATDASRLTIVYNVKQAYYTMLAAQRTLGTKQQILDKQNALLKQIQAVYELKLAALVDLRTAQLNSRSAQVDVDSAAHDLRFARIALATLMGMPPDGDFMVANADDPVVPVAAVEEAVTRGLQRRVEIKQVELSLKSSNIDLAVARGLGTPTISVSGGANFLLDWNGTNGGTINAGVKVALPILDAGGVQNQVGSILRQNDVYTLQETQLRKSITTAIQNAWDGLVLAREKLELAGLTADTSALQYQITSAAHDAGTASTQDLLTASVNAAAGQTALATAKSAVQLAALSLLNAMGY
jgi:outer membrane protein TolC